MSARYLLCPGPVRSRSDGDWHNITDSQLAMLYRVPMAECLVLPEPGRERFSCERLRLIERCEDGGDLIALHPRYEGDYRAAIEAAHNIKDNT